MYRKLAFSVVSILGLMTLVVSAQQPAVTQTPNGLPGGQESQLLFAPGQQAMPMLGYGNPYIAGDNRSRREESDLIRKSQELMKQLAKAEGEKRDKIKTELNDTLGKQFDVRQKRHEVELKALEDQVKKLRDMVQKRQDNRREIIARRMEQVVRESEGLGW